MSILFFSSGNVLPPFNFNGFVAKIEFVPKEGKAAGGGPSSSSGTSTGSSSRPTKKEESRRVEEDTEVEDDEDDDYEDQSQKGWARKHGTSVTRKKSPNVYKSCPKMISPEK